MTLHWYDILVQGASCTGYDPDPRNTPYADSEDKVTCPGCIESIKEHYRWLNEHVQSR